VILSSGTARGRGALGSDPPAQRSETIPDQKDLVGRIDPQDPPEPGWILFILQIDESLLG
jgi:hypothetical protein